MKLPKMSGKNVIEAPHVVILGAGASKAACPSGDRNARAVPVMADLVDVVGLDALLQKNDIEFRQRHFEDVYNDILKRHPNSPLLTQINDAIYTYFAGLSLPDEPTVYDTIILGLRPKDLVATFNWDPFLAHAFIRHRHLRNLPQVAFLHGNVAIGVCRRDSVKGFMGETCRVCDQPFERVPLLYPIREKNYRSDSLIADEWNRLERAIAEAYLVTIFGYSAPKSDVAAVEIMKRAWARNGTREIADIEMIDIMEDRKLVKTWRPFIVREHYRVARSIIGTSLDSNPRRTCEALYGATMMLAPWGPFPPISRADTSEQLVDYTNTHIARLIREEEGHSLHGTGFEAY